MSRCNWSELLEICKSIILDERDLIANTANLSSLLYSELNKGSEQNPVNWVGFYFFRKKESKSQATCSGRELVLGPFQVCFE